MCPMGEKGTWEKADVARGEGLRGSAKSPLTCPGEERLEAPPPGLALAVPPKVPVLLVANGDLLTLVARQVD